MAYFFLLLNYELVFFNTLISPLKKKLIDYFQYQFTSENTNIFFFNIEILDDFCIIWY